MVSFTLQPLSPKRPLDRRLGVHHCWAQCGRKDENIIFIVPLIQLPSRYKIQGNSNVIIIYHIYILLLIFSISSFNKGLV
jgi:hypothetical protein